MNIKKIFFLLLIGAGIGIGINTDIYGEDLLEHLRCPQVRAFLDTIAYAEGTLNEQGYKTLYNYGFFTSFKDHPRRIRCSLNNGELLCSSAAGRYQFLKSTWKRIAQKIGARDFTPENQDRGALELLRENGALDYVKNGYFNHALTKVNKVWSSLPGAPYGQPTRTLQELRMVYKQRLKKYKADASLSTGVIP